MRIQVNTKYMKHALIYHVYAIMFHVYYLSSVYDQAYIIYGTYNIYNM